MAKKDSSLRRKRKLTTGLVASIWYPEEDAAHDPSATVHLEEVEHRIRQAHLRLHLLEAKSEQAIDQLRSAQTKFEKLKNDFNKVYSQWLKMSGKSKRKTAK